MSIWFKMQDIKLLSRAFRGATLFSFLLLLGQCETPKPSPEINKLSTSYSKAIFYEIFVQSFADSNGDGIGDIPGMTSKLDYLSELGIDAVWLMPMSPSPSYHKYDVTDYRGIHPDYGTLEDFKIFIDAAHQRGIRVIMDLVVNHSGVDHPWFLNAKSGKGAKYRDYYVWADKDSIADQLAKKETSFDSDNIRQWHPVDEDNPIGEHYYGFFYGGMPDLNFDHEPLRKEIFDIGKFWLEEVGLDGFRLDAAKHIFPDDRAKDSHNFWKSFKAEMQSINPEVYLIGEVWSDAKSAAPYAAGFSSLFNFDRAFTILESVNQGKLITAQIAGHGYETNESTSIATVINQTVPVFKSYNPDFLEASFLSNHDQNRTASVLGNDSAKIKLAASMLFTLPGTPYLYYGEELGMLGMKPDQFIREPIPWTRDEKDTFYTKWMKPKFTTSSTVSAVSEQVNSEGSMLNHYKSLIELKKSDVLALGAIAPVDFDKEEIVAFTRSYKDDSVLVIHNLSAKSGKLDLKKYKVFERLIWNNGDFELRNNQLTLSGKGSIVLGQ